MEKLIEMIGKIVQALLSSKTLWLIIVAVAIFSIAILAISRTALASFFGIQMFATCGEASTVCSRTVIGLAALVSLALILARILIWVIGLLRDQFFA
jgi:hypothetical protein